MKKIFNFLPLFVILTSVIIFFYPFFVNAKLPIPADTIVGLYYPFRDLYSDTNPNGIPYKNFLVTDPVRQQYPWKELVTSLQKQFQLPLWNPYEMAGTPLLGNFQSSPFYPLNFILFFGNFSNFWSIFIIVQPFLAALFLFLFLINLNLDKKAAVLGSLVWAFCGFSIAWLEWGVVIHTALWLPLILLSIDKGFMKADFKWKGIFILSLASSLFAGHLQSFFYVFLVTLFYFIARISMIKKRLKIVSIFILTLIIFFVITFVQWWPTLQFILRSNRATDQMWAQDGWFIPYQNLVQFIAPDFFGNPSTINYWGIWNYGEFIGYVGITSLIVALYAVLFRRDKKTLFFIILLVIGFIFSLQNFLSQIPYQLKFPFISTAQPTRLLLVIDFCLSVLAALGLDYFLKSQKKNRIFVPVLFIGFILGGLWGILFFSKPLFASLENISISINNLKLPTVLLVASVVIFSGGVFMRQKKGQKLFIFLLYVVVLFDLFRFGWKFTPFTNKEYLFPDTKVINFLQSQNGIFRIATTDSRILPPNFSVIYRLQSIEGYDPLYLKNYAEFIAASERRDHSIKPPFGFNRIITPRNLDSQAIDFLNVKYVLSMTDIDNSKFKKVFQRGETRVYENLKVLPRAYFVEDIIFTNTRQEAAKTIFKKDLSNTAVLVWSNKENLKRSKGKAKIVSYSSNKVIITTENKGDGYLVISDTYYPSVRATIDGKDVSAVFFQEVNLAFRGLNLPAGRHTVVLEQKLF